MLPRRSASGLRPPAEVPPLGGAWQFVATRPFCRGGRGNAKGAALSFPNDNQSPVESPKRGTRRATPAALGRLARASDRFSLPLPIPSSPDRQGREAERPFGPCRRKIYGNNPYPFDRTAYRERL
jgi:hypothetical protein